MKKTPTPSHREAIALFRLGVIGDLLCRDLGRGELRRELIERARTRYRPPGADASRRFHYKTLQRWYYEAKNDLVGGLLPEPRARGYALALSETQRAFLLEMRREHRSASAKLLLAEAIRHGVVKQGAVSLATLRRLYAAAGLRRTSKRRPQRQAEGRLRWQAARPGDLWHGDVCHLILQDPVQGRRRFYVHGLLDDASRHVPVLAARTSEREEDMLEVLFDALLRHPPPRGLYLDNGSCYRGDLLALVCKRLDIKLIHAKPYTPEARGKMERFWRTMRQECTDHLGSNASRHDINQALWAWLDVEYSRSPHTGLRGETPRRRYLRDLPADRTPLTPKALARALEVEVTRVVRGDATFDLDGVTYEVAGRHLAGRAIAITVDGLTGQPLTVRWRGQPLRFGLCDPLANRHRDRAPAAPEAPPPKTPFSPIAHLLAKARQEHPDE